MTNITEPQEKRIRRTPRVITDTELNKILAEIEHSKIHYNQIDTGIYCRQRDSTALLCYRFLGLRPAELLNLKWTDINFESDEIIINPMNNKERCDLPAKLTPQAKAILISFKKWCEENQQLKEYVFYSTLTEKPITTSAFQKRFLILARESGVWRSYHRTKAGTDWGMRLYDLRHTFLTKVYESSGSEHAVSIMARHRKPESAHCYIHLDDKYKNKIIEKAFGNQKLTTIEVPKIKIESQSESTNITNNNLFIQQFNNLNILIQQQKEMNDRLNQLNEIITKLFLNKKEA